MIPTATDIVARVKFGASLAHKNITRDHGFATELLYTEPFRL
jgi:hypothetical protein